MSKNWIFVCNNYTPIDIATFESIESTYTVFGRETAPDTGTPHLQGYVVFKANKRLSTVKKLHGSCHWEIARGSTEQNFIYTTKDGIYTETGTKPIPKSILGKREKERWATAFDLAKQGNLDEIDGDIRLRCYRTLKEIKKDHMKKPEDADSVTGIWLYGEPGCGKSRKARQDYPGAYDKMQNKWWDGYQGEDYVIIDDYDSKELGHHLKIWADRYSFLAETKGGAINIRPKKIIITSNYSPDMFEWDSDMRDAIKRRFTIINCSPILRTPPGALAFI